MDDFFFWIEGLAFPTFMRESGSIWAFPMFLFLHTLGMSIVAGGATIINFAVLGLWPKSTPIKPLERFYPIMWAGFWLNLVTGVSMFTKDASIYGNNADFYIKLVFVAAGVWLLFAMRKRVFQNPQLDNGPTPGKGLAYASLACWFAAIIAGRLIAYVGPVPGL
ncbi:MAG: hypothetical protein AB7K63_02680 [Vicinamibacterales bacterium]